MDLTARDPSKVPRCILSRFGGVSEAQAERESADEILSRRLAKGDLKDLCFERHCGRDPEHAERVAIS